VLLARGRYIWPCGPWAGGTARGTAFWHGPWAARHGPHRARASTTRRPVRVMGRRPGPDTARARHDQGRGTVADTAPAPRCVTMAVAAAAGSRPSVLRRPSSSSRPRARSPGRRRTSSLWARGRAPPGRRRRTGELCPEPASPPPRAPHQSGAGAPPSPTDATCRHRRLLSTSARAPPLAPPRSSAAGSARLPRAPSPAPRTVCGTPCSQHGTMAHVSCRGPKAWPMARTGTARRHDAARRSADTARWPSIAAVLARRHHFGPRRPLFTS
jgi:hypothetical protein